MLKDDNYREKISQEGSKYVRENNYDFANEIKRLLKDDNYREKISQEGIHTLLVDQMSITGGLQPRGVSSGGPVI